MTTALAPALETAHVLACGDCAGEILAAGGRFAPLTVLPPGRTCEVHPAGMPDRAATNALVPAAGWVSRERGTGRELEPEPRPSWVVRAWRAIARRPRRMGPLTEVSTRLLVAWTTEERTCADEQTIDLAVYVAGRILDKTKGA